jgi:hypothetical protein
VLRCVVMSWDWWRPSSPVASRRGGEGPGEEFDRHGSMKGKGSDLHSQQPVPAHLARPSFSHHSTAPGEGGYGPVADHLSVLSVERQGP